MEPVTVVRCLHKVAGATTCQMLYLMRGERWRVVCATLTIAQQGVDRFARKHDRRLVDVGCSATTTCTLHSL